MGFNGLNALALMESAPGLMGCSCRMVRMQERCVRVEGKENSKPEAAFCLHSLAAAVFGSRRASSDCELMNEQRLIARRIHASSVAPPRAKKMDREWHRPNRLASSRGCFLVWGQECRSLAGFSADHINFT